MFIQVTSFTNEGLVVSFSTEGVNDQLDVVSLGNINLTGLIYN